MESKYILMTIAFTKAAVAYKECLNSLALLGYDIPLDLFNKSIYEISNLLDKETVEQMAKEDKEKYLFVKSIGFWINTLDEAEKKIIWDTFFIKFPNVHKESLNYKSRSTIYRLKKNALTKLFATLLYSGRNSIFKDKDKEELTFEEIIRLYKKRFQLD